MNEYIKDKVENVNIYLAKSFVFIGFVSFEDRCHTIINGIDTERIQALFFFRNINKDVFSLTEKNTKAITDVDCSAKIIEIDLMRSITIARGVDSLLEQIEEMKQKNIVIDISTFTHEALLILLRAMYSKRKQFDSIILLYNGASNYSKWLSKGCKEIRNVVGYPGQFNPRYNYHLIVLTGFEKERATKLVEMFEADNVSVGNGSEPTDSNHVETMEEMKHQFMNWFSNLGTNWRTFDFSCSDIRKTRDSIFSMIKEEENTVIVPMNTKLSTIAVALVAIEKEKVQIAYAIPETYNMNYSEPSDNVRVINLMSLFDEVQLCGCREK